MEAWCGAAGGAQAVVDLGEKVGSVRALGVEAPAVVGEDAAVEAAADPAPGDFDGASHMNFWLSAANIVKVKIGVKLDNMAN
jgi:hypothetical protein